MALAIIQYEVNRMHYHSNDSLHARTGGISPQISDTSDVAGAAHVTLILFETLLANPFFLRKRLTLFNCVAPVRDCPLIVRGLSLPSRGTVLLGATGLCGRVDVGVILYNPCVLPLCLRWVRCSISLFSAVSLYRHVSTSLCPNGYM